MSLEFKMRPTYAYIDLDALSANFHATKQFVGSDLKYLAVVKADAYGHGAVECSRRLVAEGVDWLGVAIPEEGVEIRDAGISTPILCLGSLWPGQESLVIDKDLTPVIFNIDVARRLNDLAAGRGVTVDIHVKIDTGMGRVGVRWTDVEPFASALIDLRNLNVSGLLTHFASADDPTETDFTLKQIARFNNACEIFRRVGHSPVWFDLANSPGAIVHPESRGNLVRLGGALYGILDDILPPETARPALKPVMSLRSQITHIKSVPAGETLGYGRTFTANHDSLIATVPVGYADGYPRALSNCGTMIVNGIAAPVVGRVSMDWTIIDVTDIQHTKTGDEVVIIGQGIAAAEIASATGTIGYEITCGITKRVPRVYQ